MNLLLIAPTCDGQDVGEAWVAYQWASRLAERHEVTLLTYHKRGRTPAARQLSGLRVVEWAEPPGLGRAERLNSMLKPAYLPFHRRARRWVRRALARGERFDLAHQPLPVAMRYPCPVAGLGVPYLVGPVGGSLDSPPGFAAEEGSAPWYVGLRGLDSWRLRHDPLLRRTYREAACVLGIAPYVAEHLRGLPVRRFEVLSETALPELPELPELPGLPELVEAPPRAAGSVRLLHVGRLVRTKGLRDTIRALDLVRDLPLTLDVVGDGFDRGECEALVARLGLADRVRFHGRLPRAEVDACYRAADVFVFPSYREPGGNVVFEAMGHGLPVVVCDRGGPGAAVDDSCGIRVPAVSPDQLARDVAAALARLVADPAERQQLGAGARKRVADIGLWERKIDRIDDLYAQLLAEHRRGTPR